MKKNVKKGRKMISKKLTIVFLVFCILLTGAITYLTISISSAGGIRGWIQYQKLPVHERSDINPTGKPIDINSPEGLAQATARMYIRFSRDEIGVEEMLDGLLKYASKSSLEIVNQNLDYYRRKMRDYLSTIRETNDVIGRIELSVTSYDDENNAYIERIHYMKNGSKYYFRQDFIKENGVWKVRGDNLTDPFRF